MLGRGQGDAQEKGETQYVTPHHGTLTARPFTRPESALKDTDVVNYLQYK